MMRARTIRRCIALVVAITASTLTACAPQPTATPVVTAAATPADEPPTLHTLAAAELGPTTLGYGTVTETPDYTTTAVTYESGDLTVSGALSIPPGGGPHPGLVLAHGLVNPAIYVFGRGMAREQDYFTRAGYVVLSLDLRSATAEPDSATALGIDLGSTLDVINGIRALRSSGLPMLDESRIGLMGHSLGGLLALNTIVAKPGLVDAAVAFAPASIRPGENVDYLTAVLGGTPAPIIHRYGTPDDNPRFWRDLSPRGLVDRVTEPLLIIHGTADEVTPFRWSEETTAVWEAAGKEVDLVAFEGEGHVFQARWGEAMAIAADFLNNELIADGK